MNVLLQRGTPSPKRIRGTFLRHEPTRRTSVYAAPGMFRRLRSGRMRAQCLGMTNFTELTSNSSAHLMPFADQLQLAVAAYLARFTGSSRGHTHSDLRCYLARCAERGLDPLTATRPHLELYIRWMQEIRQFKPSTVSRRFSVAAGFYRTCVIDGLLEHSPAEHVRRPSVPPESPTLGFTHLQFEALPTAARQSANPSDFALVAGLADLRSYRRGHRRPWGRARPPGPARVRQRHQDRPGPATPSGRAGHRPVHRHPDRRADPPEHPRYANGPPRRHPPPAAPGRSPGVPIARPHPHMLRHTFVTTMLDAGVDLRDVQIAARHADPRTTMRYDRARKNLDRHPNYILAAYMASGT